MTEAWVPGPQLDDVAGHLEHLFVGQLEEDTPGEDDAHAGPGGEAHEVTLQLDLAGSDQATE